MSYYNKYEKIIENGETGVLPFIKLPSKETDKSTIWNSATDRLDTVSNRYYGHPYGGFLILNANAEYGVDENDIPDGVQITVPFPYKVSLQQYIDGLERYLRKYKRN